MASTTRHNTDFECPKCAGLLHQVKMASRGPGDVKFININQCTICRWYYKI
ncbi:MAG: hypothetical protein ACFFBP_04365 [Promethearchaeota archaeon]